MDNKQIVKTVKENLILDYENNSNKLIDDLTIQISLFLSVEIEFKSYDKYKRLFEVDCKKALNIMFNSLYEKEQKLLIFPDVIPGFTSIIYKKDLNLFKKQKYFKNIKNIKKIKESVNNLEELENKEEDNNTLKFMFDSFFEKNNQMILSIDSESLLMMLCPVNDLDRYFKELEIYIN